jgi:hypothetical protein
MNIPAVQGTDFVIPSRIKPVHDYIGWPESNDNVPRFFPVHELTELEIGHFPKHSPSSSMIERNRSRHGSNPI